MAISLLVILAFFLRVLFVPQGSVSFHYDMARDAFVAEQIWKNYDLKILGPPTSTAGLYHGVLYYYLIAPFYALGRGNPQVVSIFLSFLNSLTVVPIILLAREIFKHIKWAFFAGFLYVIAFEATQYGPWLSNPAPAMLTVAMFFYSLWLWYRENKWGFPLAVFWVAVSSQFQFFLIYLLGVLLIFKFLFKLRITLKQLLISLFLGTVGFGTFLVATIKFNTIIQLTKGLVSLPATSQFDFRIEFTEVFFNYVNMLADLFINNFLPSNLFLGGILGFVALYFARSNHFVLFCLLSNILIFIFGGHTSNYANVGLVVPAILAVIIFLQKIYRWNRPVAILMMGLIIASNLSTIMKISPRGQLALVIPKDMVLSRQLRLIDKTYELAGRQPFSINTLTVPLWTNTTWAYLYQWYGKSKYGYVPSFYGRDQIGLLGADVFQRTEKPLEKSFFIIEPPVGIPPQFFNSEMAGEDNKTELKEEIKYGSLVLQIRTPKKL